MLQQPGAITDQLANVIQVLQLGQKTGVLKVVRGEGSTREEGTMTFIQGSITQVQSGQRSGQAALTWLATWRTCRFTFVPLEAERTTGPLLPLPHTGGLHMQTSIRRGQIEQGLRTTAQASLLRPYHLRQIEEALRLLKRAGLSRSHRHLLFLIDGQRTLVELERLTGRTQYELQRLLHDLLSLGLIGLS